MAKPNPHLLLYYLQMNRLERLLLQLTIFLVPSNLALHWYHDAAYIHGKLVDYLLPQLYLSDIPLIILLVIYILKYKPFIRFIPSFLRLQRSPLRGRQESRPHEISLTPTPQTLPLLLAALLFTKSLLSPNPISSIWYFLRLIEMFTLITYLTHRYTAKTFLQTIKVPAITSLIFQTFLAFTQFLKQSHLAGYWLFGEPTLSHASNIAKSTFAGVVKILPYGTTPHPNVLAGFVLIFSLLTVGYYIYNPKKQRLYVPFLLSSCLNLIIIFLTKSLSSMIAFVIVYYFLLHRLQIITQTNKSHFPLKKLSIVITVLIIIFSIYHYKWFIDNNSITYRYKLFNDSITLLKSHPFTGVGLNNFIPSLISNSRDHLTYLFPQPVHNIYLLWLTETGLITTLAALWLLIKSNLLKSLLSRPPHLVAPLLALGIIGLFDHYPMSLQPGLLLTTLSLSLPLIPD